MHKLNKGEHGHSSDRDREAFMEIAAMFKLLRAMFSPRRIDGPHAQISGNLCASYVMTCHSRALRSARNALSSSQGESHHRVAEP